MDVTFIDRALGSGIPYITYAIPFFFLLIGLEFAAGLALHRDDYRLNDSLSDLGCGIADQVIGIFLKTAVFAGYLWCYQFVSVREWNVVAVETYSSGGKWAAAVALLLGVDLGYYWFHRISHERNLPWAGHVVHHSSEEYNLTVALRQGATQSLFSWVFYLPLALLGFPPLWFLAVSAFDTLYQFWIHTRVIDRLGWLEWVLNTPSHHRVHHARNAQYLDKNYAGVLIVWDRWFGTFEPEVEPPVYGLTKPLDSWNPVWANLHVWADLVRDAWMAPRWADKLRVWVAPQGWRPAGLPARAPAPAVDPAHVVRYDARAPVRVSLYVSLQFLVTLGFAVSLLVSAPSRTDVLTLAASVVFVLWSLGNGAGLTERRWWAGASEALRLAAAGALALHALATKPIAIPATLVLGGVALSALWLLGCRAWLRQVRDEVDTASLAAQG
ncbi:MAG: sterol desaturase family protein [Acidobacteria bacterium]|nr:sterol desaturase family protein [Acidobacteriota bacterium]